ncbi:hypothetical protein TH66_00210 [Carbonactinospora thermoautotrophica]|uniref:4Fe-4S Wbl-type domain-containing protein n=1 Tax=Carbonactinospora thermoautotrophica TaxID=1469144 RepID=A0A132N7J9_9ACTN|nr:hypothetical protein TR74_24185 [Carbonactinospora thermoautotrophica]KWX05996.1 hypothetical protein TH66_00210 [Carbonactinospora thermoautotrophica]
MQRMSRAVDRGAACAGMDTEDFFPISGHATRARMEAADALAVCEACQVRARCLALAVLTPAGRYGIWGGLVEGEIRQLRAALAAEGVAG